MSGTNRRGFLVGMAGMPLVGQGGAAAIGETHFPNRLCQFVWRNWELVNTERMAAVLGTSAGNVARLGASMGLPGKRVLTEDQLRRIYVTAIRQNWHLLPEAQLVQLLGWDLDRLRFTLKEDDFLDHKLGPKPDCEPVRWAALTAAESKAVAAMRAIVREVFGAELIRPGAALCGFVGELSDARNPLLRSGIGGAGWTLEPVSDPRLARAGERFLRFVRESFGGGGSGRLTLTLQAGMAGARTTIEAGSVRVEAGDTAELMQALYALQDRMEELESPVLPSGVTERKTVWSPRYLYSYFALYGDPLFEPEADPFPDAYLEKLARAGINGVWLQGVLNTLAPSAAFPEFGKGSEIRLRNLSELVRRAGEYGVRVYLYLNEPRAMPAAFFAKRPEMRGSSFQHLFSMCTSNAVVRDWVRDSLGHVFRAVPELGGVFTISMSENHTNCFSHGGAWG